MARRKRINPNAPEERQLYPKRSAARTSFRFIVLACCAGYFFQKTFRKQLMPWGPAAIIPTEERLSYVSIDSSNDSLQAKHGKTQKIFERVQDGKEPLMKGPETVVFGKDGSMYLLTEEANLIKMKNFEEAADGVNITAEAEFVKDLGVGRPLGGKFTTDGKTLYIADALLGLTRVQDPQDPKSKVEIVASNVMDGDKMTQILYADDVCVGPKTGKIYLTDASDIASDRIGTKAWDTLYASKVDLTRGLARGRLLEYDPSTDEVSVLARGFKFANGIAVDKEENYLLFAETFGLRIWQYHLKGDKKGQVEVFVDNKMMTGYPDGVDCSWSKNGKCYAALPSAIVPAHKLWNKLPYAVDVFFRTFILSLPRKLAPKVKKYGGVIEIDAQTKELRYIQDPTGDDISMITGVTEHDKKLYLGSLQNNFIGVYKLD